MFIGLAPPGPTVDLVRAFIRRAPATTSESGSQPNQTPAGAGRVFARLAPAEHSVSTPLAELSKVPSKPGYHMVDPGWYFIRRAFIWRAEAGALCDCGRPHPGFIWRTQLAFHVASTILAFIRRAPVKPSLDGPRLGFHAEGTGQTLSRWAPVWLSYDLP